MHLNLGSILQASAESRPEHPAIRLNEHDVSYAVLDRAARGVAASLRARGVEPGDAVALMIPNVPDFTVSYFGILYAGCTVVPLNVLLSAPEVRYHLDDSDARMLIAHGLFREPAEKGAAEAGVPVVWSGGEGDDSVAAMAAGQPIDRIHATSPTDTAVVLYTSGTTGKPKGIVHGTGGYLTGTYATTRWVFDLRDEDVFWCTADIGWITGHSYVVYGPLAAGATIVMYEGAPDWPERDRFWEICEQYGVTVFYTAPTAIRAFMKWGEQWPRRHDLSRLRLLGTVGEPINPEAWTWYHEHVGGKRCPIVDTWWQTETGQILISPLPGLTSTKPGSATLAFPGIEAEILTDGGDRVEVGGGYLAVRGPWPARTLGIWGDEQRFIDTYWSKWDRNTYFPGDGAKRDEDGYLWILGRVDDVMNVAGHRIGTMEVESALVDHEAVAEAAVVGIPHDIKGTAIAAFVTVRETHRASVELEVELKEHVAKKIGAIARPQEVLFAADLPKTRSGKIMRRLLRDIAEGKALGDTTTLADPAVVERLKQQYEESGE
jgi:acetyl-CoA synthetase